MNMPKIPIDKIFVSEHNIRKSGATRELEDLAKSIKDLGLINPVTVIQRDGKYELVAGQRRFLAVKDILKEKEIDAKILPSETDSTTALIYSMSENLLKINPSYTDYVRAANILYDKYGGDVKKIAQKLNISFSRALYFLRRRVVPVEVAKLCDQRKLSWSKAQQLAEALWPDKEKIIEIAYKLQRKPSTVAKRVIKAAKINPRASTDEIFSKAESLPVTIRLNYEISENVLNSIKEASKKIGMDVNDIIEEALKEWLENRGWQL